MKQLRTLLPATTALVALAATGSQAQAQRRVTGVVTGEGNAPLSGATVQVVGATTGTYTNEQGRFSVQVGTGPQTLRVRRIGYRARTINLTSGQTEASVALERDVLQLEAQVVTGTATVVARANAANAVAVVSDEQLNRVPAPTIDNALQGKVAGAVISQNSGAPGGGTQIQLRGVSTINGDYSPLYVVDGVIVNNSAIQNGLNVISGAARGNLSSSQDQQVNRIADLNPNDIENIQVLKGPSASSIYGSRGTNGVVIITTKQGSSGRATADFAQRLGTFTLANKLGQRCFQSGSEYSTWAANVFGDTAQAKRAANAAAYNAATTKCNDYEQQFYGNQGLAYQTLASLRGGSNNGLTYYVGGLAQRDPGLAIRDGYNKQSLRVNLGQTIGSRVTVRASTEAIHTLTQRGISGNDNNGINPYTIFSSTPSFVNLLPVNGVYPVNPSPFLPGSNPFQNAAAIQTPENVYRLIGSVTGTLSAYASERQTVDLTLTGGVDTYADRARIISPATTYTEQGNNGSLAGTLFNSDANSVNANLSLSAAHRYVAAPFTATTSVGLRQEYRDLEISSVTGRGVVFPSVTNVAQASQTFPAQQQDQRKFFSYFAQEEFLTLSERLLLTAGVNAERASTNGNQLKFYAFPKASASYRIPILPSFVDELKGRVAYGLAGNQPTAGRFTFLTQLLYEGAAGARASTIKGAENIKPELSRELEGGFDATFLKGRARLSFTQYKKNISDLLLLAPIAPSTGFVSQYINGGKISSHGTEIEVQGTPVQLRSFTWTTNTTFNHNYGKYTDLPVPAFNPGVGSFSTSYGNAWVQFGQSTGAIQSYNGCRVALSASGACPSAQKIPAIVADANPNFVMGFNNEFTYKGLRLSSLFDWRKGGYNVNLTNNYYDANNIAADTLTAQRRYAAFRAGLPAYVEKATFLKLRELTLSYQLPESVTGRILNGRGRNATLQFAGRNLKTWTPYTGLDPEVSNFSNQALGRFQDVTPYPPSRSFYGSIAVTY